MEKKKRRVPVKYRKCVFCGTKTYPDYKDIESLSKYVSDRASILSGDKTGICTKHQRGVSQAVKRARHLGLLPFVSSI
jgi:small subunit ribosomal protein S18